MSYAYAVNNALSGLAASAFTLSPAPSDLTTRAYLNDSRLDRQVVSGSASASHVIDIDLGSAKALVCLAILNHNALAASPANFDATAVVEATADATYATGLVTVKALTYLGGRAPAYGYAELNNCDSVLQFAGDVNKRYWRVTLTLESSAVLKVGELFAAVSTGAIGDYVVLPRGSAYGSGEGEELATVQTQFQGGDQRVVKLGGPVRERRYSWVDFTLTQAAGSTGLKGMWRATNGPVTPFLWIDAVEATATAGTEDGGRCIFGRLQLARFDWTQDDYGVYQPPGFVLRSMGREIGA